LMSRLVGCRLAGPGGLRRWGSCCSLASSEALAPSRVAHSVSSTRLLLAESFPKFVEMVEDATDSEVLVVAGLGGDGRR
jgi:hypothetical protein